jgi:cytochrome c biogenesis protein CcmG/thiol:disulfide interchange protein DsbE
MPLALSSVKENNMKANLCGVLLALAGGAFSADQPALPLQPVPERKLAPGFELKDASGKTVKLTDYRDKVVLLDFWATWCTGCKQEIPWFSEFQKKYGSKEFAVVGVSLDEDGWKALTPFLASTKVGCQMLLGDEPTAQRFNIRNLPDTFLIDQEGKVAAAYLGQLVDRDTVEAYIQTLLAKH